nr:hypothetical protein [archaeon]
MGKKKISGFDEEQINKVIEDVTKLGIGLAIISKDALEKTIKSVSKKKGVSEKDAKKAVESLVVASKRKEIELKNKLKRAISAAKEK